MARTRDLPLPTRRRIIQALGASGLVVQGGALGLAAGCGGETDDDDSAGGDETTPIRFAVITDMHLKPDVDHTNNQVMSETIQILNAMEPPIDFVLLTGDLIDELPSDDPTYYDENTDTALHRTQELLAELAMPWFAVLGNHDYYISGGGILNDLTDDLQARETLLLDQLALPGLWYRHDQGGIALYGLNTMQPHPDAGWTPEAVGSFGPEQVAWLQQQLSDGTPCVLFFHHPLALDNAAAAGFSAGMAFEVPRAEGDYTKYEGTEFEDWTDPIYAVLEQYADQILAVFVGHGHWFVLDELSGFPVMMTDSTGNSPLQTTVGQGDDAQPMRYHLVEIEGNLGALTVVNGEWFDYNV